MIKKNKLIVAVTGASGAIYASSYDGHHGNDEFIAILPQDFNISSDSSRTHASYTDDDGATTRNVNASMNLYAMKIIPKGFTREARMIPGVFVKRIKISREVRQDFRGI